MNFFHWEKKSIDKYQESTKHRHLKLQTLELFSVWRDARIRGHWNFSSVKYLN